MNKKVKNKCEFGYVMGVDFRSKPECKKCVTNYIKCQKLWLKKQ